MAAWVLYPADLCGQLINVDGMLRVLIDEESWPAAAEAFSLFAAQLTAAVNEGSREEK